MPYDQSEFKATLNPFGVVQASVFGKECGTFLGCIHFFESRLSTPNGPWRTIGRVDVIDIDDRIHAVRIATEEELDSCFQ